MYDVDQVQDTGDALVAHGSRVWPTIVGVLGVFQGLFSLGWLGRGEWLRGVIHLLTAAGFVVQANGLWRGVRVDGRGVRWLTRFRTVPWSQIAAVEARNYGIDVVLAKNSKRISLGLPQRFLPRVEELRGADGR